MYTVLLLLGIGCACALPGEHLDLENAETYFEEFIIQFDKKYANEAEKEARFKIFKDNLVNINRLNEENEHAVFGINRFMDLTSEEFIAQNTGLKYHHIQFCDTIKFDGDVKDVKAPEAFDWRDHNAVTRVKDQGFCGSCWAFSTSGHVEGQYAIKHGKLVELSEQQHVDCDDNADGCDGGYMSNALRALRKFGGPMTEVDYPYVSAKDEHVHKCKFDKAKIVAKADDCVTYNLTSQEKVKQLLYKVGPLPIAIQAKAIGGYASGIISDKSCNDGPLNHGVLLVGYGKEKGVPFWIVKNSWGKYYGESGYFRMERSDNRDGACGMLNEYMATLNLE